MKLRFEPSQRILPFADPLSVTVLVELLPPGGSTAHQPLDLRFVLDRSSSMNEAAGNGRSKMDVLTESVVALVGRLELGRDQLSVESFDSRHKNVQPAVVLQSAAERARLCRRIEQLKPRGWTRMASALKAGVSQPELVADAQRRVVLFTDGCLTDGGKREHSACLTAARSAGRQGRALTVFATGEEYDEAFLRQLTEAAGGSSSFAHVLEVSEVLSLLEQELVRMRAASSVDVNVAFQPAAGFEVQEIQRFVPSQSPLTGLRDRLDAFDDRGQRYLVRGLLRPSRDGNTPLFDVDVRYTSRGCSRREQLTAHVEVTGDAGRVSAPSARVIQTVYNAAAVQATMLGDIKRAQTLFTQSKNTSMLQALNAFGTAGVQSAQGRKLRTVASNDAHLQAFGSAAPAPVPAPARRLDTQP